MREVFFTVGPTQLHPRLEEFMRDAFENDVPSMSHRGKEFADLFLHATASIKKLLNIPPGFHIFFLGSATEAMERFIENCVERTSFHVMNGAFAKRFFSIAQDLKKQPVQIASESGRGIDVSKLPLAPEVEAVCFTQNETSNGSQIPMEEIYGLKKKYPDKLFAVDIVSSAPYAAVDYSLVDCTFFSVQKGFGMPAGLGVLIVNERCIHKAQELQEKQLNIGTYHNFPTMLKYETKSQTPETPNVLGIYLLGRIADAYLEYGVERIRKETTEKARLIYDFFDRRSPCKPFVRNPLWRSETVIVIETPGGSATILKKLAGEGFIVSSGYGQYKGAHIRIANFPTHTKQDVERLLAVFAKS